VCHRPRWSNVDHGKKEQKRNRREYLPNKNRDQPYPLLLIKSLLRKTPGNPGYIATKVAGKKTRI
jgi:hypothetical protein